MDNRNFNPAYYDALASQRGVDLAAMLVVGQFQGYVEGEPYVSWADRKHMPQPGDMLYIVPQRAARQRSWAILLTSANHGVVGPLGHVFKHAGEHHERVQVVEIVDAGAPPAPDADLAGLVRLPLTDERIDEAWDSLPSKFWRGQGEYEWNCEKRRAFARAIEREVAAQAGQVAVPEGWKLVRGGEDIQLCRADGKWCGYSPDIESPAHRLTHEFLSAMLAAAPSPAKESK